MGAFLNRRGLFGPFIVLVLLVLLIWVWVIITPSITPIMDSTISQTQSTGVVHGDGVEFFVRMIPWAVPGIIVLGFLWLMVRS